MTLTLFDLTYKVAVALGSVIEGKATGGSATTIIDTVERLEADNYWIRGTAWILRDSGGVGGAPEREYSVIVSNTLSTNTITLRETLTAVVAAGDKYALGKRRYPLAILIQKINAGLVAMGTIPLTDIVTIPALASSQSEYSLPIRAGMDLRRVFYALRSNAADHDYQEVFDWDVQESPTGTADKLILPGPYYSTGNPVKLEYMDIHPSLNLVTDQLNDGVHPDRVVLEAVKECLHWRRTKVGGGDPTLDSLMVKTEQSLQTVKEDHPIDAPPVAPKLLIIKRANRRYPGDRRPR